MVEFVLRGGNAGFERPPARHRSTRPPLGGANDPHGLVFLPKADSFSYRNRIIFLPKKQNRFHTKNGIVFLPKTDSFSHQNRPIFLPKAESFPLKTQNSSSHKHGIALLPKTERIFRPQTRNRLGGRRGAALQPATVRTQEVRTQEATEVLEAIEVSFGRRGAALRPAAVNARTKKL